MDKIITFPKKKASSYYEKLWAAMFISEGWYELWRHFSSQNDPEAQRKALLCKTVGIVEYDRCMAMYDDANKSVENLFVYKEERKVKDR